MVDKKIVVDVSQIQAEPIEVDLTKEEITQRQIDLEAHNAKMEIYAKNRHLYARMSDPDYPPHKDMLDALWLMVVRGDASQAKALDNTLQALEAKYPPPA